MIVLSPLSTFIISAFSHIPYSIILLPFLLSIEGRVVWSNEEAFIVHSSVDACLHGLDHSSWHETMAWMSTVHGNKSNGYVWGNKSTLGYLSMKNWTCACNSSLNPAKSSRVIAPSRIRSTILKITLERLICTITTVLFRSSLIRSHNFQKRSETFSSLVIGKFLIEIYPLKLIVHPDIHYFQPCIDNVNVAAHQNKSHNIA